MKTRTNFYFNLLSILFFSYFILDINFHDDWPTTGLLRSIRLNFRLEATLNCGLRLEKFPFDVQECPLIFESCKLLLLHYLYAYYTALFLLLIAELY